MRSRELCCQIQQLLQVTTHSHLLSQDELQSLKDVIGVKIFSFFLHEFDTELDFTNKLRYVDIMQYQV